MKGTKVLGLAAIGALLVIAAPAQQAQALSLSNPGAAAAVQQDTTKDLTTEVRWHHHWGWHHHHHWHRWHHWHHWHRR
jgi:ABC-type glycerol-3-phosphate transport system substrate-binding protein